MHFVNLLRRKNFQLPSQLVITCSKLLIETLEQGVKYVLSSHPVVSFVNFEHVNAGSVVAFFSDHFESKAMQ